MSSVVTRRTRARAAGRTDSGARGSSRRYRRVVSAANAFDRSQTDRGLPTGTIALRRRRARVTLFAFVGERAFGFASDVAVAFRVRGSMFSLFSSSQLVYARCRGKAPVFRRPGLPAFCGARFPAASGPMSTFVAPCAGMRDGRYVRHSPRAGNVQTKPVPYVREHGRLTDGSLGSATPGRGLRPAPRRRSAAVARSSVRRGTGAASSPGQKRRRQE